MDTDSMTSHPHDISLDAARSLVQRAVDKAEQLGLRGGVAVVGASGALVTASRLDLGGPGGMARATSQGLDVRDPQSFSARPCRRRGRCRLRTARAWRALR